MSERRRHPIGTGLWDVWRLDAPESRVRVEAHTAFEAHGRAVPKLGYSSFSEVETELVADTVEEKPKRRRQKAKAA